MRSKLLVLCAAVLALPAVALPDALDSATAREIRSAAERLGRAETARDGRAIMEVLADDVALFPPGEEPISGKEDAARWLAQRAAHSVSHERSEPAAVDVCGDVAIESGSAFPEAAAAGAMTPLATRYLSVWKRRGDGWKLAETMWTRYSATPVRSEAGVHVPPAAAEPASPPVPAPAPSAPLPVPAVPPIPPAPPSDYLPIPDSRRLSDGYVRTIADQVRGRAAKIRSLQGPGGSGESARAAISKADRELQAVVREVGWIDVGRFGVRTACDAAFIVSVSEDPVLIRSAVPRMGDLQSNPEGEACYAPAYEAYRKLPSP